MTLFQRVRNKAMHVLARNHQDDLVAPEEATEQNQYPTYYYELDEVQKSIYQSPFGPDGFPIDAWTDPYYETWFNEHRATESELESQRSVQGSFPYRPLFSIIVPLYKTPLEYLQTMADSVLNQTYTNFQLILVNASPDLPDLAEAVRTYAARDKRIDVVALEENMGITENTNAGLAIAKGDFCSFLDHDDSLEPDLLFEYVKALNHDSSIDVLYCDEDLVSYDVNRGSFRHLHPLFKPALSPELLLCKNYIVHLMTIRKTLIDTMPRPDRRFDGAQDYNMILYSTSHARKVQGVQKVLYHWRISAQSTAANPEAKPYSRQAYKLSAYNQLQRQKISGSIVASGLINIHNIWMNDGPRHVTLIVDRPSGEKEALVFLDYLKQNGIIQTTEIILLLNDGPDIPRIRQEIAGIPSCHLVLTQEENRCQRFNSAVDRAQGDYLIFVDTSCAFITPEPISQLSTLCAIHGVGVSSPKTIYRDGSTKCFGVAVTSERIMPLYRGYPDDFPAYQCNMRAFQNVSACSLQGLCISRELFGVLGGFDVRFTSEIAAADLCKRILERGMRVVATPTVKIEINQPCPVNQFNLDLQAPDFSKEDLRLFDEKWPDARTNGDPYYNMNLNQSSPYYQLPRP